MSPRKPLTPAQRQAQAQHTRNWRKRMKEKGARFQHGRLVLLPRQPSPAELEEREMDRKAAESLARMDGGCYL